MTDAGTPPPEPSEPSGRRGGAAWLGGVRGWAGGQSWFAWVMVVVALGLLVVSGVLYQRVRDLEEHPEKAASIKQERLEEQISGLFTAPSYTSRENGRAVERTDTPRFTLVTGDTLPEFQLSGFREARVGDYVVTYPGAQVALLYREDEEKIIATINDYDGSEKPLVVLVGDERATGEVEDRLLREFGDRIDIQKQTQQVVGLQKPLIVDVTGKEAEAARRLARTAGGRVGAAPSGAALPQDAAFVVYASSG